MPVSTDPCGKLIYTIPSSDHETQLLGKVDWTVNSRQTFFARYYVTDYLHPFFYKDNILTMSQNSSVGLADRVNTVVVGHTFVINQDTTNSLRASFARSAIHRTTPVSPTPESLGVNAFEGVKNYMFFNASPDFTVDCQNCSPGPWISNDYQVNDDLTLVRGKHQIALGRELASLPLECARELPKQRDDHLQWTSDRTNAGRLYDGGRVNDRAKHGASRP